MRERYPTEAEQLRIHINSVCAGTFSSVSIKPISFVSMAVVLQIGKILYIFLGLIQ